ncbi:WXG100 family type VII secretion target [Nanchangia anserum]|uniref:ESAT-6-like protein n=1 Tax=Nanchangia anserum TaxID=2692125 RepID=A0A8I0GEH7_9ACTO|nr:WXG100 family type VII secretion target [Nanchangia anserum]MBD3690033.1 WXG100 family type VII secretion target [Nanchangia anserum]QOX82171.1 WXG100 family type VII secretion target [Nanchangia anserum]
MAHYVVDSASLSQSAAHMSQIGEHIRADVAAMMGQLGSLQSSWSGQGQLAFADCASRWHAAQLQVESALDHISAALAQASATYEDAETQTVGLFAG